MKIKNIEAFREELFKNIKNLWFDTGCDIYRCSKTMYEDEQLKPENRDIIGRRTLEDVLVIEKYHYNDAYKKIKDRTLYITVYDYGVCFYKNNIEEQRFQCWDDMEFDDYSNKTEFAMQVAIKIMDFIRR